MLSVPGPGKIILSSSLREPCQQPPRIFLALGWLRLHAIPVDEPIRSRHDPVDVFGGNAAETLEINNRVHARLPGTNHDKTFLALRRRSRGLRGAGLRRRFRRGLRGAGLRRRSRRGLRGAGLRRRFRRGLRGGGLLLLVTWGES